MTPHIPYVVLRTDAGGRHRAVCESCMDGSTASFHRPAAEAWRREHIRQAVPPNINSTRSKP